MGARVRVVRCVWLLLIIYMLLSYQLLMTLSAVNVNSDRVFSRIFSVLFQEG